MADYKRIIKNVLFIALVPSVVVGTYYGYKAIKNWRDNKNKEEDGEEKKSEVSGTEEKEVKVDVVSETNKIGEIEKVEAKIIPITRGLSENIKEEDKKIKEA